MKDCAHAYFWVYLFNICLLGATVFLIWHFDTAWWVLMLAFGRSVECSDKEGA